MAVRYRGRQAWWRLAALVVAALAVAGLFQPGPARAADKHAVLIVDANTGRVLFENSADESRYPASLTKMMTLYLVFELIDQGRLSFDTKLKISANAAAAAPSKLDLEEGDEIALIDAIKILITKSANDLAVAIAEHIAGSEQKFARLMTQKARQLGMTATTFRNASGLPDEEQVTTARDMITLALRLQDDFPKYYPLFATRTFTYKDETFRNHNKLLVRYEGTDGIKTGYTNASGFNLVASVRRGPKHIVGVIFGGATASSRDNAMRTFLNMALVKGSSERTRKPALVAARPKPAPERKIVAAVPTPQRVERPLPAPSPAAASPAEPAAQPAQPIEIARVRPVLVTPHAPLPQPAPTVSQGATIETLLSRSDEPPAAGATESTRLPPQWATASSGQPMRLLPAAPSEKPALLSGPSIARGAPPSTFEQQAANLARGERPVAVAVAVPAPVPVSPPPVSSAPRAKVAAAATGGFQIQIGAYQSAAEAERQLAAARERAGAALSSRAPVTLQVQQGGKLFYRARFAGFEAQTAAASACTELKRLKIDCLVMKAE